MKRTLKTYIALGIVFLFFLQVGAGNGYAQQYAQPAHQPNPHYAQPVNVQNSQQKAEASRQVKSVDDPVAQQWGGNEGAVQQLKQDGTQTQGELANFGKL